MVRLGFPFPALPVPFLFSRCYVFSPPQVLALRVSLFDAFCEFSTVDELFFVVNGLCPPLSRCLD